MADVLPRFDTDRLIDFDRLRDTASQGTGRGVRVAILDTGVESSHPALEGCVKETHAVVAKGSGLECVPVEGTDPVGHGTACAGIIHAWAPDAEIHSIRVLGKSAAGTGEQFLYGIALGDRPREMRCCQSQRGDSSAAFSGGASRTRGLCLLEENHARSRGAQPAAGQLSGALRLTDLRRERSLRSCPLF